MTQYETIEAIIRQLNELTSVVNKHSANIGFFTNELEQQQATIDHSNNRYESLARTLTAQSNKPAELQDELDHVDGTAQNAEREVCNALERNESLACAVDVNSITLSEALARITALELLPPAIPAPKPEAPIIAALREENRDLITRLCALQEVLRDQIPELRWYAMRQVDLKRPPIGSEKPWSDNLEVDIKVLQDALDESLKESANYSQAAFAKAGTPWTVEEDQRLLREHLILGRTVANIARMHQRTRAGIEARLERLNQDKRRNA